MISLPQLILQALLLGVSVVATSGCDAGSFVTDLESPELPAITPGQGPAELPRLLPDTSMPGLTDTIRVTSNLQSAIDAATSGTLLLVEGEHVGNYYVRSGSGIQIQGGSLRTENSSPALTFEAGTFRWKVVGTRFRSSASETGALVQIQGGDRITLDSVDVHGHDNLQLRRCVLGNGTHISVLNSSLTGCHANGFDSQAFVAWNGAGPYWLEGNVLEGAGENIMFGGADSGGPEHVPADITIRNNLVRKPAEWRTSGQWSIKNLFELKTATRVLVEDNTFDGNWSDAQTGFAFVIKSVNQSGGTGEWSKTTDVTIRRNTIRNSDSGINLHAHPEGTVAEKLSRVVIEDNLLEAIGHDSPYWAGTGGEAGRLFQILSDIADLRIRHNEAYGQFNNQVVFEGAGKTHFVFENNIIGPGTYGFQNAANLDTLAPGASVTGNIFAPATWNDVLSGYNCVAWPPSSAAACSAAGVR